MISVYHGQDIQPNIAQHAISSAHFDTAAEDIQHYDPQRQFRFMNRNDEQQDQYAKDSVPPEPLPPNLSREHKLRQQQQKLMQQEEKRLDQQCFLSPDTIQHNTSTGLRE